MADNLEQVARLVTRAVQERLGDVGSDVLEVVVKEVMGAMSGARGVPAPSTPAAPASEGFDCGAAENTAFTTGRGSVVAVPPTGEAASLDICSSCLEQERARSGNRAVVTTTGSNRTGVVAAVASTIAEAGGDIQDMSQTLVAGFFTMIMVVDIGSLQVPFEQFQERIATKAQELGIHAVVMHESVLHALQRV
jgi:ACT domain-containing protein